MSHFAHAYKQLESVRASVSTILEMRPYEQFDSSWASRQELSADKELVEVYMGLFAPLSKCRLVNPALYLLDDLATHSQKAVDYLAQIRNCGTRSFHAQKDSYETLIADIRGHCYTHDLRKALQSCLTEEVLGNSSDVYLNQLTAAFAAQEEIVGKSDNVLTQLNNALDESQKRFNTVQASLDAKDKAIADILAKIGTRDQSIRFHKEANLQWVASYAWMVCSAAILGALVYFVFNYLGQPVEGKTLGAVVPHVAEKVAVVTLGSIALVFCLRNYGASKHNSTVNRHREHALNTFDYFTGACKDDPTTRNAVLLETTKVIFSPVNTGYLKTANESNGGGISFFEIVRHVADPHNKG